MKKIEEKKIRDLMTFGVITLPENASVIEAVYILVEGNIHGVVVVNERREPIGVISGGDIPKAFGRNFEDVKVTEIMHSPIEVVAMDNTIKDATEIMKNKHIHRLIVIDENKEMRGILSLTDIIGEIYKITRNTYK